MIWIATSGLSLHPSGRGRRYIRVLVPVLFFFPQANYLKRLLNRCPVGNEIAGTTRNRYHHAGMAFKRPKDKGSVSCSEPGFGSMRGMIWDELGRSVTLPHSGFLLSQVNRALTKASGSKGRRSEACSPMPM